MPETYIHPSAVVDSQAKLGKGCYIGPYCVVGAEVSLGNEVRLESHVAIAGDTKLGDGCQVFPFASLGHVPQDLKFKGEKSTLEIGAHTVIREHVTMNPGTEGGGMRTRVGDHCLFMVGAHVAHDCLVGNHVILANNATLAGHVVVGDHTVIGGLAAVHQFVRIGRHAMIGGMSGIEQDVIPFGTATGERAHLSGLNLVGMKRRGLSREAIHALRDMYRALFADNETTFAERVAPLRETYGAIPEVMEVLEFLSGDSSRSILHPTAKARHAA